VKLAGNEIVRKALSPWDTQLHAPTRALKTTQGMFMGSMSLQCNVRKLIHVFMKQSAAF